MSNLNLPEYEVVCLHCRRTLSGEEGGPFGILARGPTATLLRHCPGAYFRTRPISHSSTSLYSCVTSIRQLPVGLPLLCLSFTPNLITVILYTINSLSLNYLFSSRSWILSFRLLSPVIIKSRCRHYAFRICSYFVKCDIVDKGRLGDPLRTTVRSIDRLRATSPSTWNWRSNWRTPAGNADFQSYRLRVLLVLAFSGLVFHHTIPWPSIDIHRKFYGYRPRGTPPSGNINARG